jgi:hypothetical protein
VQIYASICYFSKRNLYKFDFFLIKLFNGLICKALLYEKNNS